MPQTDLTLAELLEYRSSVAAPADLREFWIETLGETARHPLAVNITPVKSGLVTVETYDVTFGGFGGHPIRAWLHVPAAVLRSGPLPGIVQYQGYNGGRGLPHEHVFWASAGYAHLVVDTRGQGSGWTTGATGDPVGSGPSQPGYMTRGIDDPHDHYYRRVFTDAVRALGVLRSHCLVDPTQIAVTGASQGGGMALAVAALASLAGEPGGEIVAAMPDVPFLCDMPRAARIADSDPYGEIARYLKAHRGADERVFTTLSYFDGAVLGRLARVPALFSVALMDQTCPPSTVFGAYHEYAGPKDIEIYEFNDHEGGEAAHRSAQLAWLADRLQRA